MPAKPSPLADVLALRTREGELYEKLPEDRVRCFACGHRCLIPPGRDGVCRVRFNEAGTLRVPFGYVGALQVDPVEKKPFFHALPGARALSFGMLGCDYHCGYCFAPGTEVTTPGGPRTLDSLFEGGAPVLETAEDAVAVRPEVDVVTHLGRARPVRGVFRHHYRGPMMALTLAGGTEIRATPEHEFLVTARAARGVPPPSFFVPASAITPEFDLLEPTADGHFRKRRLEDTRVFSYDGPVYNIEVEEDQTYLVHGAAVHNCQNWVTSQALRDPRALAPAQEVTPAELVARPAPRRAHRHLDLQRAAHHQRVGGGRLPRGAGGGPRLLVRLQRQRDARGARLHPAVGVAVQGGPQELPRPALPRAGRHAGERAVDDPRAARAGLLARDRHARHPRLQRLRRGAARHRGVPRRGVAGHAVARDRVPQGLQDDGRGRDVRPTLLRAAEIGAAAGLRFVYAGNLPGRVGRWEHTWCPGCGALLIERFGFRILANRLSAGACPDCRRPVPGFWEADAVALSRRPA